MNIKKIIIELLSHTITSELEGKPFFKTKTFLLITTAAGTIKGNYIKDTDEKTSILNTVITSTLQKFLEKTNETNPDLKKNFYEQMILLSDVTIYPKGITGNEEIKVSDYIIFTDQIIGINLISE